MQHAWIVHAFSLWRTNPCSARQLCEAPLCRPSPEAGKEDCPASAAETALSQAVATVRRSRGLAPSIMANHHPRSVFCVCDIGDGAGRDGRHHQNRS
jgi:hypothetical protein